MLDRAAAQGRGKEYVEALIDLRDRQRAAYAATLGADPADVALTTCTSDGVVRVLGGLDLGPGDEVLTAPDEHPGCSARSRRCAHAAASTCARRRSAIWPTRSGRAPSSWPART